MRTYTMTTSAALVESLAQHGIELVAGVPCSYLTGVIRRLERHSRLRYVPAANEGSALAIAAGARCTRAPAAVIAQNSGFGNLINPLTSLVLPYRIPLLVIMSLRGWPAATAGEPQHRWMGQVVPGWLDSLGVPHWMLTSDGPSFEAVLEAALGALDDRRAAFILVAPRAIDDDNEDDEGPAGTPGDPSFGVTRDELVRAVLAEADDGYLLSTTGYMSRALWNLGDRPRNFYLQGAMGHVLGMALGAALSRPQARFLVLDGDGSVLMHMGPLATVGHFAPANLVHILFDNGAYESTGAQPTAAAGTDFCALARACGYRHVRRVATATELRPALREACGVEGPSLVAVAGPVGSHPGERASSEMTVEHIAERFASSFGPGPGDRR